METSTAEEDFPTPFYVGQHESKRSLPVTSQILRQAQKCTYDMLTIPITTPYFHSRVLALHARYLEESENHPNEHLPLPIIPSLTAVDTSLRPDDTISQLLAIASPWIDICSADPLIHSLSCQVLDLELAYAAFCGIGNVIVLGPSLRSLKSHGDGIMQYALAIKNGLEVGNYIQIEIKLPMMDMLEVDDVNRSESLAYRVREDYVDKGYGKAKKAETFGTWDAWNLIRTVCNYSARLFVALSIPRQIPPLSIQSRWFSEPLRVLCLDSQTFVRNRHNYEVLSKPHQGLIYRYMRVRTPPWILLCDVGPIPGLDDPDALISRVDGFLSPSVTHDAELSPTPSEAARVDMKKTKQQKDLTPHLSYIRHLQQKQPQRSTLEKFATGFQDYLQAPLQPLADNLESIIYEVFEKDPVKYEQYEKAIAQALKDWVELGKAPSGPNGRVVVAVVGAGRGPLVTRALQASQAVGVKIELWAVEKNPNAYVVLQHHNEKDWNYQVNLVQTDMRAWKGPLRGSSNSGLAGFGTDSHAGYDNRFSPKETYYDAMGASSSSRLSASQMSNHYHIDILVSELLGSFADNELSPECLDGILPLLNPKDGISIPASYTAFLTPINAPKLHADISARAAHDPTAPHTPSVVMLHAIDFLSTDPSISSTTSQASQDSAIPKILPAWSFTHGPALAPPASSMNRHNKRHAHLTFRTCDRGVCHGLAGYFESVLYPGIELSTNPLTMDVKSAGMMSWFPIFFPLKTPLYLPDHAELTVTMARCTDNRKVWYDWAVESWGWSSLIGGETRKVRLGGGEVGSSKAGGCLM